MVFEQQSEDGNAKRWKVRGPISQQMLAVLAATLEEEQIKAEPDAAATAGPTPRGDRVG